ncbi:MAG TPA: Nramp family divalent metal transporter [Candidatus Saccharimonadales bacterium]|nr:Nramp family divalent metal transporter [Candidatus Saccharimonadales bacterium]
MTTGRGVRPKTANQESSGKRVWAYLRRLGPGLVTGAADDDPSGIATYSQVGAQFGFAMLWTMLFSFPLMTATQEICGRIGRITGAGIAENVRKHYPRPLLYALVLLLCGANVFNLSADVSAMAAAAQLLAGGPAAAYVVAFGAVSLLLEIYVPYTKYVRYLKWLTLVLFAYVATVFVIHVPWGAALRATVLPSLSLKPEYLLGLVAVLGTTISPYLFFWQASEEAEDVRRVRGESALKNKPEQASQQFRRIASDTRLGMGFSNLVAFFIILTAGVTLHNGHSSGIETSADAARALEPLAGRLAFVLFASGIIGTGLLAVPVLAGSAAYGVAETFRWRASLETRPQQAPKFYAVLSGATILGVLLNFWGIDPIRALYWSAILNGITAVPLLFVLMLLANNKAVVGKFTLPGYLLILGWAATAVMTAASVGVLWSSFRGGN